MINTNIAYLTEVPRFTEVVSGGSLPDATSLVEDILLAPVVLLHVHAIAYKEHENMHDVTVGRARGWCCSPMHHGLKIRMKEESGNSFKVEKELPSLSSSGVVYVCTHTPYLPTMASAGEYT